MKHPITTILTLLLTSFAALTAAEPPTKAKAKAPRKEVGPAIGQNKATPVDRIKAAEGFSVELIHSVPGLEQGSWIALCTDDKGRIYASDQFGGLHRFPAPPAGQPLDPKTIESVPAEIRGVNGMHFADGALYLSVNDYEKKIQRKRRKLSVVGKSLEKSRGERGKSRPAFKSVEEW